MSHKLKKHIVIFQNELNDCINVTGTALFTRTPHDYAQAPAFTAPLKLRTKRKMLREVSTEEM